MSTSPWEAAPLGEVPDDFESAEWGDPKPLSEQQCDVPAFDPALLPKALRDWVEDIAGRQQCPIEYVAIGAMVALGAVAGRKHEIFPKRNDDWRVVPNLWGAAVGLPGDMKSPALDESKKPLERLAMQAKERHQGDLKNFEFQKLVVEQKKKAVQDEIKAAVKAGQDPGGLQKRLEECTVEPPIARRYVVNDPSVEKLGELLEENPNGLLLFRDELMGWLASLNKDGNESARAFYLEAWDGYKSFTYDRIQRGTVHIESACVSILGGIQPGPLNEYLTAAVRGGSGADGLMQRFQLLVYPNVVKVGDVRKTDRWPNGEAKNRAFAIFEQIDNSEAEGWRFSPDAQEIFYEWWENLLKRLRAGDEVPAFASHLSKYQSLMPALSLLLHMASGRGGGAVSADAAKQAIAWCELLEAHARRVYQAVIDQEDNAAHVLAKKIKAGKVKNPFTVRDIYHSHWAGIPNREVAASAIEILEEADWIRAKHIQTGGRSTVVYSINPKVARL